MTADDADDAPSPCTDLCELDPRTQVCRGCARTLDEIVGWPFFTLAQRRAVLERLRAARR